MADDVNRDILIKRIKTRYSEIHLGDLGDFLEKILRGVWKNPAYKLLIAANASPISRSSDRSTSFSFYAVASTPDFEMHRYRTDYRVDIGDEDSDPKIYCKKWLESIAKEFRQVEGVECRLEGDKLALSYHIDKGLKSYWEKLARIALAGFPKLQKGERVSPLEIKRRLGKLREADYTTLPYSKMNRREVLNYFVRVCDDIISQAKKYCPEVLDEVEKNSGLPYSLK